MIQSVDTNRLKGYTRRMRRFGSCRFIVLCLLLNTAVSGCLKQGGSRELSDLDDVLATYDGGTVTAAEYVLYCTERCSRPEVLSGTLNETQWVNNVLNVYAAISRRGRCACSQQQSGRMQRDGCQVFAVGWNASVFVEAKPVNALSSVFLDSRGGAIA